MKITGHREIHRHPGVVVEVLDLDVDGLYANLLALKFEESRRSLSGEQGYRHVKLVCNCYMPGQLCDYLHSSKQSFDEHLMLVANLAAEHYGIDSGDTSLVSTGVDMREMEYSIEQYEDIWIGAWVTAGFKHNALRVGVDQAHGIEVGGKYFPCGTINVILVTNAKLNLATMASSFITITEAKGIALQDLRIHSSFNPKLQATGTGTDQIVVVAGNEFRSRYVGGHTKLGELIARAVTKACTLACRRQLAKNPNYHQEN